MDKIATAMQVCPKCLTPDIEMRWRQKVDEPASEIGPAVSLPEAVRLRCQRCHHLWYMAPADAAEEQDQ